MDRRLPNDFDPYSFRRKPSPGRSGGIHDEGQSSQEGGDEQSFDDGFLENHEGIPVTTDARFTSFLNWVFGIAATLVTLGIVWIANVSVSTAAKVDRLLDRPPSVPVHQYENDMQQLKERVKAIEQRQLASQSP
jgi:hypothetical protein